MLHFFAQAVSVTRSFKGRFHKSDKLFKQITTNHGNYLRALPALGQLIAKAGAANG
jgi:hypothetical protein